MDSDSIKPAGLPTTDPVLASPPPSSPADTVPPAPSQPLPEAKTVKKSPAPLKQKKAGNNQSVALAIIATVIIVIGIAALAVYAYLKQH